MYVFVCADKKELYMLRQCGGPKGNLLSKRDRNRGGGGVLAAVDKLILVVMKKANEI